MKRVYLKTFCATLIAALALAGSVRAANETGTMEKKTGTAPTEQGKLDRHDQEFLKQAAEINLTEISLGQTAERMSSDPNIKKMAGMLVKDHTEANRNLERLAASKGVKLPTEPSMSDRHSLSAIEKEQGDKFNKEFLSFNMKGHEKAISLFEKEAARTQDPDIKAWAQKMVPALKEHLAMSQSSTMGPVGEKSKEQMKSHQKSPKKY
ncbi:MAG: DUF4142 domain-containing protein [Verrucomicrobia bacterium]|nr:DUF4142 domain-containing protein [Verrucomicrobiota bacterium]